MVPTIRISFFLILGWFFYLTALEIRAHAEEPSYVDHLLQRADQRQLHKARYWWTLLHYERTPFGAKSLVDDPAFFLAKDGRTNPQSELEATIKALFEEEGEERDQAVCRFIARYTWLREELSIDASRVPSVQCPAFNELMEKIDPQSATLIFVSSNINSPASMFGHDLISIDTSQQSELLSHAINYSASTTETNGFVFAFKGLFGFYEGYFLMLPYYEKLKQYSDIYQRNIWEYHLNLTEEEVRRMAMHLWELQEIYSYYYFLDENCSYSILYLLEAARPSIHLTGNLRLWVLPLDTIRAVKKSGLINDIEFRPSKTTRIKHILALLDRKGQTLALSVIRGRIEPDAILDEPLSQEEKAEILDVVLEYVQYQYIIQEITKDQYLAIFLKASNARSRLGKPSETPYSIPVPARPDEGHRSKRLSIGFGVRDFDKDIFFHEIMFRPCYHDLLDPDEGFSQGYQIEAFNTALRYYFTKEEVVLQHLDILDVQSLAPRDKLIDPFSWKIRTGLTQLLIPDGKETLVYQFTTGAGLTYTSSIFGLAYILPEVEINGGKGLKDYYSIGLGGSLGILKSFGSFWKVHLCSRNIYYPLAESYPALEIACLQRFKISTNNSINADFFGRRISDEYSSEVRLYWNVFF